MSIFRRFFDFYLQASIHVALAVYALVRMTYHMFHLPVDPAVCGFAFFGTVAGYNFVKYDALARVKKIGMSQKLRWIAALSFVSLAAGFCCFLFLERITQMISIAFLAMTMFYTLPFFPNGKNARNWAGVKIYMVSLCWVGVTLALPIVNEHAPLHTDFYFKCLQRFLLVFVLILIFEIIDMPNDDPRLHTVPQQFGIRRTKIIGLAMMVVFYFLEFFKTNFEQSQLLVNAILVVVVALFLLFANEKKSRYYTAFWVESIPVFWWLLVLIFA